MSLDLDAGRFGVFSLLPAVVDAVKVPVVATGELRTGAGVAAALLLGAFAAQVGTALLCPEAKISELGQMGCSTWIRA